MPPTELLTHGSNICCSVAPSHTYRAQLYTWYPLDGWGAVRVGGNPPVSKDNPCASRRIHPPPPQSAAGLSSGSVASMPRRGLRLVFDHMGAPTPRTTVATHACHQTSHVCLVLQVSDNHPTFFGFAIYLQVVNFGFGLVGRGSAERSLTLSSFLRGSKFSFDAFSAKDVFLICRVEGHPHLSCGEGRPACSQTAFSCPPWGGVD